MNLRVPDCHDNHDWYTNEVNQQSKTWRRMKMTDMPKRDVTGDCEGECKDQVSELQKEQQEKLDAEGMEHSTAETPTMVHAKKRDNAPGDLGGYV
jgi:hypothetical protein